jgi:hypothetical protein
VDPENTLDVSRAASGASGVNLPSPFTFLFSLLFSRDILFCIKEADNKRKKKPLVSAKEITLYEKVLFRFPDPPPAGGV